MKRLVIVFVFLFFLLYLPSGGDAGLDQNLVHINQAGTTTTVYVTATGDKYHNNGCRYLSKSKIAKSLEDACKEGYKPCSVCNPPSCPNPIIGLSKSELVFSAIIGGANPANQQFQITNNGGGILDWSITDNATWLTCTPTSGTGNATITTSVNISGLAANSYTGSITVSSTNANNSPQTISAALIVNKIVKPKTPFGDFATPTNGATGITGAIPVTGWALDDVEVAKVEIKRDPLGSDPPGAIGADGLVFIGNAIFVEGARPDVEKAYPDYPFNKRAGWGYMLLTNFLPYQGNGGYKIYAYATDTEGNQAQLGFKNIICSNTLAAKPFGTIDTPPQGGEVAGSLFVNFGWVLTPKPKTIPKDGSTIRVFVDGIQVGDLKTAPNVYNQYRVDVATAFPGLNNSSGPVGAYYLDTTEYANGVHTIYWIATDDAGAADGIGSRYFKISNLGASNNPIAANQYPDRGNCLLADLIENIPTNLEDLKAKKGFKLDEKPEVLYFNNSGVIQANIKEIERIEIELGDGKSYLGYMVVGDELRSLPIGSTLDQTKGVFTWLPGPGFLGQYDLVFIKEDKYGMKSKITIQINIRPKYEP